MDRNYGSLGAMNKGSAIPSRHNRSTWTAGYIIGDPFFLTTISIALVPLPPKLRVMCGIDWMDYRLCCIHRIKCLDGFISSFRMVGNRI